MLLSRPSEIDITYIADLKYAQLRAQAEAQTSTLMSSEVSFCNEAQIMRYFCRVRHHIVLHVVKENPALGDIPGRCGGRY
jgi:hypothetical protein